LEALKDHDVSVDVGAAALLTGELASNAARHGGEPIGMSVSIEEAGLRVTVHDEGSGFDPLTVIEGSGGLRLVDKLSSKWGVEQTKSGTDVWFEI
jgi:anti-sigma regulatory factor (Ser/Thr protein kinase)